MNWKNFEWIGHHKLYRIITIEGAVENTEPLHIGCGPGDLKVLKVFDLIRGEEVPVIPGSSWKGVLRAGAVALAGENELEVCDGLPKATCLKGDEFDPIEKEYPPAQCLEKKLKGILSGEITETGKGVCLLCLIFGTPGLRSHIDFYDSIPISEYKLGYRRSVAISRRTGAATQKALFTVEYVEPGCIFSFKLTAVNLPNYALGLIASVMKDIDLGLIKIGGLKSRGYGTVRFIKKEFKAVISGIKGVRNGVLEALDPYDHEIKVPNSILKGSEAWNFLEKLSHVWTKSVEQIKEVSNKGWKWIESETS